MSDVVAVMIVDDHPLFRRGLVDLINSDPGLDVIAEAGSGEQAIETFQQRRPAVVLMDLNMPGMGGVAAIRRIVEIDSGAAVVVLSSYDGDVDIKAALAAGALGYLLKESADEEVLDAIAAVRSGRRYLSSGVEGRLREETPPVDLSERELEVLQLLARGLPNREIGSALGMKEATVKVHVRNILAKLDVSQRTEAAIVALQRGIVHL